MVSYNQYKNILSFTLIFDYDKNYNKTAPSYLTEKFNHFIGEYVDNRFPHINKKHSERWNYNDVKISSMVNYLCEIKENFIYNPLKMIAVFEKYFKVENMFTDERIGLHPILKNYRDGIISDYEEEIIIIKRNNIINQL